MHNNNNITPIFVIGTERSGTKWLTRIIATNEDISAIINDDDLAAEAYFERFDYHFPNVERVDDYIALVELFSKTYVSKLINVDRDDLYYLDKNQRPKNYYELFNLVMNKYTSGKEKP